MTGDPFVLSAFSMSTVSHGNYGLWRHPADQTSRYTDIRYWVDLARLLDDAGFDLLFLADAVANSTSSAATPTRRSPTPSRRR